METISDSYGVPKRDMFKPLIMARKILTLSCTPEAYSDWIQKLKALNERIINDDDREIIYRVLAILFFKYEHEIVQTNKHQIEEILDEAELDTVRFYNHFYNDDMRVIAIQTKAMDMLERRNKILFQIADNDNIKPMTRINALKALDSYINSCLLPNNSPSSINVYGHAMIDASHDKQIKSFDMSKLTGQDTPEFKKLIKEKRQEIEEIIEIEQ